MTDPAVAIIDIGSNSIKLLVASRTAAGGLLVRLTRTLDVRISAGLGQAVSRLSEDSMLRGVEAVRTLLQEAAVFAPARSVVVATSAVRDAQNGPGFREQVRAATGQNVRILTGDEEANLIGRGLTCDPALVALEDFYVFDLGGGSLECLAFHRRKIQQAVSLQLGCVRLTEKLIADPSAPFSSDTADKIHAYVESTLVRSSFRFEIGTDLAVATGGTATTARAILAATYGQSLEDSSSIITLDQMWGLFAQLSKMTLAERKKVPGLAAARADVMPTALMTLLTLAETVGFKAYRHSLYNLRYGLAAEALDTF